MSEFSSEGAGREYPSLFTDENYLHKFSILEDDRLWELHEQYRGFIEQPDTFKPHLERAERVLEHVKFEILYRSGAFSDEVGEL